ncbi:MAG: hypothetical protein V4629_00495 [Pseudomonadota bacterium]
MSMPLLVLILGQVIVACICGLVWFWFKLRNIKHRYDQLKKLALTLKEELILEQKRIELNIPIATPINSNVDSIELDLPVKFEKNSVENPWLTVNGNLSEDHISAVLEFCAIEKKNTEGKIRGLDGDPKNPSSLQDLAGKALFLRLFCLNAESAGWMYAEDVPLRWQTFERRYAEFFESNSDASAPHASVESTDQSSKLIEEVTAIWSQREFEQMTYLQVLHSAVKDLPESQEKIAALEFVYNTAAMLAEKLPGIEVDYAGLA